MFSYLAHQQSGLLQTNDRKKDMIGEWRFQVHERQKFFKWDSSLVAVEQTEPGKMLTKLTLHADLNQITLKQNSVVLADEPETSVPTSSLKTVTTATAVETLQLW